MAEEQKPVEVVQEQIAAAVAPEAPAVETADVKTTEETKPVEAAAEAAAPAEEKKEVKPVEEGHLGHKAQGAAFPKYVYIQLDLLDNMPAGRTINACERCS